VLATQHLLEAAKEWPEKRYFTVYGPRQRPDMAFTIFCRAAVEPHTRGRCAPGVEGRIYNVGGGRGWRWPTP
jgi:hypothetical protein